MKTLPKEKLTAYALEELSATERAEFEALLAASPEDQEYAGETREFCQLLQGSIGGNAEAAVLTDAQKQEIVERLVSQRQTSARASRWRKRIILSFIGTSAGAAAAVMLFGPYFKNSDVGNLPAQNGASVAMAPSYSDADILAQSKVVAEKRAEMIRHMKQYGIVDYSGMDNLLGAESSGASPDQATYASNAAPSTAPSKEMKAKSDSKEVRFEGDASALVKHRELAGNQPAPIAAAPAPGGVSSMRIESKKSLDLASDASPAPTSGYAAIDSLGGSETRFERSRWGLSREGSRKEGRVSGKGLAESLSVVQGVESENTRYRLVLPESRTEPLAQQPEAPANESYIAPAENPFRSAAAEPLSTFSIDVDTASYANVRRFLNMGQRPPAEAVRLEELVNYFRYDYPAPAEGKPCSITADLVSCPWNENHRLARVGLKARTDEKRPNANLVFLLDVSGSMNEPNKLPLVKKSLHLLVDKLTENDRVSIVVYAGASGLVLPPTHGANKAAILGAIDNLQPGGSTNGASGITLAYEEARKAFIKEGVNRVILATDGDFNVGISDRDGLQSLIEKEAKSGVFLSVLGYGMGNLKDSTMEVLADKGNGNYAYIDSLGEARKVLAEEMSSTLVTVAKDVKVQIDFNPAKVRSYRLLGYENRMLAKEDFNNDKKDAGEMGAGHTVTALYEIIPTDAPLDVPAVDPSKYQTPVAAKEAPPVVNNLPDSMTVKVRYKAPDADVSQLMELPVIDQKKPMAEASGDTKFATAVAGYALLLKGSNQAGNLNWALVRELAKAGKGADAEGYRGEFMGLVDKAEGLVR